MYQGFPWIAPDTMKVALKTAPVSPCVRCRTTDIYVLLEVYADRQYEMPTTFEIPRPLSMQVRT